MQKWEKDFNKLWNSITREDESKWSKESVDKIKMFITTLLKEL